MKKDIVLIYPPMTVSERYGKKNVGNVGGNMPPLGLASIAAVLEKEGFSVSIIDGSAYGMGIDEIVEEVKESDPLAVGVSCLTVTYNRSVAVGKAIKKALPGTFLIAGGQHITIEGKKIFSKKVPFDVLVCGEGELTATELLRAIKQKKTDANTLEKINGVIFRKGKKTISGKPRELIKDLDTLPFPAYHLLRMEKYGPLPNQYKRKPVVNVLAIRGCPFFCTYCSASSVFGRGWRAPSPGYVFRELKYLMENFGVREISFWDDTLTVNKKWLMELCGLILKNKLDLSWSCYGRVNTVDLELLKKMKEAGCWNIFYGIEAGDQRLLDIIKKGTTLDIIRKAIKLTKEAGIQIRGSFMLALPGETPELGRKTIDFAIELDPDYAQFSITTPFPGTPLFDQAKKYGTLSKDFSKYHSFDVVFIPHGYKDAETIYAIKNEAFRRFYMRPQYILGRIGKIRSVEDILRYVKGLRFVLGLSN